MSGDQFLEVIIPCRDEQKDMLSAELDSEGFDSIMETDAGINAYIPAAAFDESVIDSLADRYQLDKNNISWCEMEVRNWNEEWETNFEPVVVDDLCLIRAPFHEPEVGSFKYELIIQPKMSFGTGHHATTYLMVRNQIINVDHQNKKVLDAGCGTAILAVMAEKLGASKVIAFDIDDWSRENAPENVAFNNCERVTIMQGTIKTLSLDKDFDIILANINKNVLLDELSSYYNHLVAGGHLLLSGFYEEDMDDLEKAAREVGFTNIGKDSKDRWACLLYKKQ